MKKNIVVTAIILVIVGAIGGGIWYFLQPKEEPIQEYTPQEEITEEQIRQSMVTLYFYHTEDKELAQQSKLIDVKNLLENPYKELMILLMEKPSNEKLESVIPEGTLLNKAELSGNTVIVDFSKEFIENHDKEKEPYIIQAIVKTLTQLTEVNSVKITIDGQENQLFSEGGISLETVFSLEVMA